jgi:hypothetical protein
MKGNNTGHGNHKVVAQTIAEQRNLIQEAVLRANVSLKEDLLSEVQKMLDDFRKRIDSSIQKIGSPQHDPDEDIFFNVKQTAAFLDTSRATISKYQKVIVNGEPVIRFNLMKRISKAECKRIRASGIIRPRPIARKKKK